MKLKLAAALLGLAIGGCAHSRSVKLPEGPESPPIGVDPVPSIHDSINRGTNPAVARSTLPDPANPNWSGASAPERPPATGLAPRVATTEPPAQFRIGPEPTAAPPTSPPSSPPPSLEPETAAAPRTALGDPTISPSANAPFDHDDGDALPPVAEVETPVESPAPAAPTTLPRAAEAAVEEDPLLGPTPT